MESLLQLAESNDRFQETCKKNYVNTIVRSNHKYESDKNNHYETIKNYMNQYPIFNSVYLVQLHPSAENGYPHTRANDIICVPSNMTLPSLEETLSHEVVHIHQRNNPAVWEQFLNREGWFLESPETIPFRWREKCRINPDTFQKQFWSFNKRYIPLPLFFKDSNVRFDEIKVMYYDLQSGVLEHETPKEITNAYGKDMPQPEHPYEIYAVILGKQYPLSNQKINRYMNKQYNMNLL